MEKYKCPCCGFYTLDIPMEYDICPVCYWEDDPAQRKDETYDGGANKVSLIQARKNYKEFGACEDWLLKFVRQPNPEELSGIDD
ncbi:MAG: hydrolase [Clostridia bacterium]|nr:hydrolase [Clostridia bacterium]